MGWKWVDEPADSLSPARGLGSIGELENSNPRSTEDRCSTMRVISTNCRTEEVEPGRFIRKCANVEQIFRSCIGRPTELVESRTEHTEDDVTDEIKSNVISFGSSRPQPFNLPGFQNEIEAIERGLSGGFSHILGAAEEMANDIFNSLNIPSFRTRESPSFDGAERQPEQDVSKKHDSPYSEISGEIKEL
ncbi:hypothetical protein IHE45_15G077700 [Dioscorea alata]|uniref:Uncharacterized protein n=1 Tax=Dioscorea alata TaxID=55571 RepID=A0ACB7UMD3_DIOAL|nr:hypothetical protein IHE45_15G077700 [Dioscorea alata]